MSWDAFERGKKTALNLLRLRALTLSRSYRRLFDPEDPVRVRDCEIVLADLRDYCRATASTFDPDPHVAARNQGRRDVFLRIAGLLHLEEATVRKLMELDDE